MNAIEKAAVGYDADFCEWLLEQARLIRQGSFDAVDRENLAEEIEGLSRSELREADSHVTNILVHLTCLKYSPDRLPVEH